MYFRQSLCSYVALSRKTWKFCEQFLRFLGETTIYNKIFEIRFQGYYYLSYYYYYYYYYYVQILTTTEIRTPGRTPLVSAMPSDSCCCRVLQTVLTYERLLSCCLISVSVITMISTHNVLHGGSAAGRWTCNLQVAGSIPGRWLSHNIGQLSHASLRGR